MTDAEMEREARELLRQITWYAGDQGINVAVVSECLQRVWDKALEAAEKKLGFSHKIFTPETPAFQMGSYNEGINGAIKVVRALRAKGRRD